MSFKDLVAAIQGIVDNGIIPFLYALAFILFLIGMVRYFFIEGEEGRKKGKDFMLAAGIGFFVLFAVWGLVRLLLSALTGTA